MEAGSPRLGASMVGFWWGPSSWLSDGHLLTVPPSHGDKARVLLDEGPTLMTSFNLNYPLKTLSPDPVTLEARASMYRRGGGRGTIQSIAEPSCLI